MSIKVIPKDIQAEKPSVLILDDEVKICQLIDKFLFKSNMFKNIVVAHSVSVALMKLRNEKFDLVIVDFNLPDKLGTEFIEIVTKSTGFKNLKFILISGMLDDKTIVKVMSMGVSKILVKPFGRVALIKKVCETMEVPYIGK